MKTCTVCKIEKEREDFYSRKSGTDGLQPNCKVCCRLSVAKWKKLNPTKVAESGRKYRAKQTSRPVKVRSLKKRVRKPERNRKRNSYAIEKARRDRDPLFRISKDIRSAIRKAFKAKGWSKDTTTNSILGCSFTQLETHLILSAVRNYGIWLDTERYHIDHIIPLATAKTPEDIKALNHYTNLQWLTPFDNLSKGSKVQTRQEVA